MAIVRFIEYRIRLIDQPKFFMNKSNWILKELHLDTVDKLVAEFNIPSSIASVMSLRGLSDRQDSIDFFRPSLDKLHDPFLMTDMDKAVSRVLDQIKKKNKIMIFGDYDVDGVTSTSCLYLFFQSINHPISYYIPHRDLDGYGLSKRGIDYAKDIGASLIITCDCGISAFNEIEYAKENSIDVIVTDHHKPSEKIPSCSAVINPNRQDCNYPFKGLCGAGVAFKLIQALISKLDIDSEILMEITDFVTLGIIADVVPMQDENRAIAFHGMKRIRNGKSIGIRSLIESSNMKPEEVRVGQLAFWIIPKINAAGRIGDASRAVKLMISNNLVYSRKIAIELEKENEKRKNITFNMQLEAEAMVDSRDNLENENGIVLFSENWHPGVVGIVASRIKEKYNRPTIVISVDDGIGKGSCRSIPSFDIVSGLDECSEFLTGYGGHPMAAGLTAQEGVLSSFQKKFIEISNQMIEASDLVPYIYIDIEMKLEDINSRMLKFLDSLEPYGPKNPRPVFMSKEVRVVDNDARIIGKDNTTVKFIVSQDDIEIEVIGFNMIECYEMLLAERKLDLVYCIGVNTWGGKETVQLELKEIRFTDEKN